MDPAPNTTGWLARIAALIQAWTDAGTEVAAAAKALSAAIPEIVAALKAFKVKVF